jgi:hypothetical protein
MVTIEPIFEIGDEISWFEKVPWHKEDGPFIVVKTHNNDPNTCVCGQKGKHAKTNICQTLPKQLVVVRVKDSDWVLLDQGSCRPAQIASRFFRKVV